MSKISKVFNHISHEPVLDLIQNTRSNLTNLETEGISKTLTSGVDKCLWNEDEIFRYTTNTNIALKIVSSNANDTSAGNGARQIKVSGLQHSGVGGNSVYTAISETATMNGTTLVNLSSQFYRVLKVEVVQAGATSLNQGNIKVVDGSGNCFGTIEAGDNVSNMLIVSPETGQDILCEALHVSAHFQTPTELKINIFDETLGLQKTIYKFFLSSNSDHFTFKIRKKISAGQTLWASLNPLAAVTGSHNQISAMLEATKASTNVSIPAIV